MRYIEHIYAALRWTEKTIDFLKSAKKNNRLNESFVNYQISVYSKELKSIETELKDLSRIDLMQMPIFLN